MKIGASVLADRTTALRRAVASLVENQVLVGIPATTAGRNDGPIDNATLGYIHETGSPSANIPARPFLRPGVAAAMPKITTRLRRAALAGLAGSREKVMAELNAVGIIAQSSARAKITNGPFQPLAASTLRDRRRRGFKGTKPLIVTGQLRRALTYVIRKRKV